MSTDQALPAATLPDDAVAETPFYIPATGTAARPRRTLKYGNTFAVVDTYGDIGAFGGRADINMVPASSNHPGGVNALFGDGSVKFIKSTINFLAWYALATPDGGELVGSDQY